MAKLTRLTNKIFGENATASGEDPAIGQFGSALDGTFLGTGDVATIQSKAAWSQGWVNAVTSTQQYPALPEMTGVMKVLSYQNGYLLQEGIPEWDSSTTYYKGSVVKVYNESKQSVTEYISITDNNQNNQVTDTTNWKERTFTGVIDILSIIYPVGSIYLTVNSTCPIASVLGSWQMVASGKALWTGDGTNGGNTIAAGLPNITGTVGGQVIDSDSSKNRTPRGAFYLQSDSWFTWTTETNSLGSSQSIGFNASNSSSIYGSSSTVQPPAYIINAFRRIA